MLSNNSSRIIKIFYCYAEPDEALRLELEKHLSPLRRLRQITGWFYRDIRAGTDWAHELEENLDAAHIILFLISPDFIHSDYCYSMEMQRALERQQEGLTYVIPIIVRPVYWEESPFGHLDVTPTGGKPVTQWTNRDEAWLDVTLEIRRVVKILLSQQALFEQETQIIENLGSSVPIQSDIWRSHDSFNPTSHLSPIPSSLLPSVPDSQVDSEMASSFSNAKVFSLPTSSVQPTPEMSVLPASATRDARADLTVTELPSRLTAKNRPTLPPLSMATPKRPRSWSVGWVLFLAAALVLVIFGILTFFFR